MTIKERAEEYATQYSGNIDQSEYNAYYDGATDQREIDIERLKEILNYLMIDTKDKASILTLMRNEQN